MQNNQASKDSSVKIINTLLEKLSEITLVDGKPMDIVYSDFVGAILTFTGMALSQSIFENAVREIKQHNLKEIATELTIAFRQTLDKSLGIEYEKQQNKEVH